MGCGPVVMQWTIARRHALSRWDAESGLQPKWAWPPQLVRHFGELFSRRIEPQEDSQKDVPLGSIHFDGSLSFRNQSAEQLKGSLFVAHAGDVVYSKIDVRNGAITVVPDTVPMVLFTNEFPVYTPVDRRVVAEFIRLLFQTAVFREKVRANAVGHSGRRRTAPEVMEALTIPLPTRRQQRAIVQAYRSDLAAAAKWQRDATAESQTALAWLLEQLGVPVIEPGLVRSPVTVARRQLARWSAEFGTLVATGFRETPPSTFPSVRIGADLCDVAYGIAKSPSNRPSVHAKPYLRVANVQDGFLDLKELKYIEVPPEQMERYRLLQDDLLICEGNSLELVGRPAFWDGQIEDCVHQNHVIRVRVQDARLSPRFLLHYMSSPWGRLYFRARAKRTTNLATINSTDVKEFPVPLPPRDLQDRIVGEVDERLAGASAKTDQAAALKLQAKERLERRISGELQA